MNSQKQKKEGSYKYIPLLVIVLVTWGIVPGLAKLAAEPANLPGDITTFYVNWPALAAVALIITIQSNERMRRQLKKWDFEPTGWQDFRGIKVRDYLIMAGIGLAWPLIYSLTYFEANREMSALTTILNYTWPAFALGWGVLLNRTKPRKVSIVAILLAVAAVGLTCFFEHRTDIALVGWIAILGGIAAIAQGFYSAAGDRWKYNPWVMTLVVEAVTVIGSTALVAARGSFVVLTTGPLLFLCIIGVVSNGIGFWAFLAGSQKSGQLGMVAKSTWLIGMCLVPLAQVALLPILGAENVSPWKWVGVGAITASFFIHKMGNTLLEKSRQAPAV